MPKFTIFAKYKSRSIELDLDSDVGIIFKEGIGWGELILQANEVLNSLKKFLYEAERH